MTISDLLRNESIRHKIQELRKKYIIDLDNSPAGVHRVNIIRIYKFLGIPIFSRYIYSEDGWKDEYGKKEFYFNYVKAEEWLERKIIESLGYSLRP